LYAAFKQINKERKKERNQVTCVLQAIAFLIASRHG